LYLSLTGGLLGVFPQPYLLKLSSFAQRLVYLVCGDQTKFSKSQKLNLNRTYASATYVAGNGEWGTRTERTPTGKQATHSVS